MQSHISETIDGFDGKLEKIMSDLEEMAQLTKQPSKNIHQIGGHLLRRSSSGLHEIGLFPFD
jgi:hypothetical protein